MNAGEILQREFLEIRCKILELAAAFDRLDRADGDLAGDVRVRRLHEALDILRSTSETDRAEQVQLTFSRPYDEAWQKNLNVNAGR